MIPQYAIEVLEQAKESAEVELLISNIDVIVKTRNKTKPSILALWEITGKDFGKDPARWLEWWERKSKLLAAISPQC